MMQASVGTINLECLMSRANILFTSGYRFRGELDTVALEASFLAVVDRIEKFEHRLHFQAQNDFLWQQAGAYRKHLNVIDSDDIDNEFQELCRHSLSMVDNGQHSPMVLTVIRDRGDSKEFIVAQTSEHTYVDARSSEVIFNRVIEHYNASMRGDTGRMEEILAAVGKIKTIGSEEMVRMLTADGHDREANIAGLVAYPVADVGEYAIPLHSVPDCLENYKKQRFAPVVEFFDVKDLLAKCRAKYPEVTRNSVLCAALAKGFYNLNRHVKNKPEQHLISFKMLSDLLGPELRQEHCGNFIAFVPVSVEGDRPIEQMAKDIHDRVRHFKRSKLDVTIFKLTEEAVDAGVVGTADDPLSFVVTNWSNHTFLHRHEFMHGCESLSHRSGVNIEPKDTLGAILVNRPILVINMSKNDELCLSFFPSLRSEQETLEVAEHIGAVIRQHRA